MEPPPLRAKMCPNLGNGRSLSIMPDVSWADSNQNNSRDAALVAVDREAMDG